MRTFRVTFELEHEVSETGSVSRLPGGLLPGTWKCLGGGTLPVGVAHLGCGWL